jgi:hypothetical protein
MKVEREQASLPNLEVIVVEWLFKSVPFPPSPPNLWIG